MADASVASSWEELPAAAGSGAPNATGDGPPSLLQQQLAKQRQAAMALSGVRLAPQHTRQQRAPLPLPTPGQQRAPRLQAPLRQQANKYHSSSSSSRCSRARCQPTSSSARSGPSSRPSSQPSPLLSRPPPLLPQLRLTLAAQPSQHSRRRQDHPTVSYSRRRHATGSSGEARHKRSCRCRTRLRGSSGQHSSFRQARQKPAASSGSSTAEQTGAPAQWPRS